MYFFCYNNNKLREEKLDVFLAWKKGKRGGRKRGKAKESRKVRLVWYDFCVK